MSITSLQLQTQKINEYRTLKVPYEKKIAGFTIEVLPHVYPGGTDSELLAESLEINEGDNVLDLCTGNGIVALATSIKGANEVIGTDINPAAIVNARKNKKRLGLNNINFIETNLFPAGQRKYDIVSINPPYTDNAAEDKTASCFWDKDNKVIKTFFKELNLYLKPDGKAYITWSSFADQKILPEQAKRNNIHIRRVNSREGASGFTYSVYELTLQSQTG